MTVEWKRYAVLLDVATRGNIFKGGNRVWRERGEGQQTTDAPKGRIGRMSNHRNIDLVLLHKDAKHESLIALAVDQHFVRKAVKRDRGARIERQRSVGLVDHDRRRRVALRVTAAAAAVVRAAAAASVKPHGSHAVTRVVLTAPWHAWPALTSTRPLHVEGCVNKEEWKESANSGARTLRVFCRHAGRLL